MSGSFLDLEGFQWAVVDKLDPGRRPASPIGPFGAWATTRSRCWVSWKNSLPEHWSLSVSR